MSANVKSILANANLTETEGKVILDNLGVAAELFPLFKDKLSASIPFGNETDENNAEETDEALSSKSCNVTYWHYLLTSNFYFFKFTLLNFVNFVRFTISKGF